MNRLSHLAVLLTVALGMLVLAIPAMASAQGDPIGGLIVIPGTGSDLTAIRLRTSAGCPARADAYYATMKGHGFPPDGQVITPNTKAGMSHSIGFDVYVAQIMRDYAAQNHTTLAGRYDITVSCIDSFTVNSFGDFTGSLEYTSPTAYQAIGAARPTGPPPPRLALAGDGSALDLGAQPPAGAPPRIPSSDTGSPRPSAGDQPHQQAGSQPVPGVDSEGASTPGQLTSRDDDVTGQRVPWLNLVLIGAALVTTVASAAYQIRKRRSS